MSKDYQPPHDLGISWGTRGFRIGRSQYGTWWVSLRLPFGFRISRRLGRERDPKRVQDSLPSPETPSPVAQLPELNPPSSTSTESLSNNQKILERMRSGKPSE